MPGDPVRADRIRSGPADRSRDAERGPVIGKISAPRGKRVEPLIRYLFGPGRREEHSDAHVVAGWRHPAELEPPLRSRAVQALRDLDRAGTPVTFAGVAQAAGISRSWLYTQPDISSEIRRLRGKTDGAGSAGAIPAAQRASDTSLRARLAAALDRNRQLAHALGDLRSSRDSVR